MEAGTSLVATAADTATGGVSSLIALFGLVIIPFIVKFWNWSKETSAQGILYQQLSDMVQTQRKELDKLYEQRKEDQTQIFELKHRVEHLSNCENVVEVLKKKLDQKDQIIAERDSRITKLLEELMQMKDRVHNLEIRIRADEETFCNGCSFKQQYIPGAFLERFNDE